MAADEDERKSSSSELSDIESTNSSSDGESDAGEPQQVEWLVTSRAKRSTAGNRLKAMLATEEPAAEDSDLELLFAEDEDDAGFTDDAPEDASDVLMDSSSDDEDKEDNGDELEGEKELERQARAKRAAERKRKAQDAIPARFRKKVRIEQPAPRPPRPKKKSERLSWLPSPADMPTRASERRTTKMSKQQLHEKMMSDELRRKKQLERMERKAKQLEAMKKPPMTQAERLAEAAIVEKRNSKSLNRWEEAEKQREEERLRKIAALHSRKLDGPVITFWSGIQELQEGQDKHVGNLVSMEEKAPRKKRQSAAAAALAAKEAEASTPATPTEKPGEKILETPNLKTEQTDTPAPAVAQPAPPVAPPAASAQEAPAIAAPAPISAPTSTPISNPAPAPPPAVSPPASALVPPQVPATTPASAPLQTPAPVHAPATGPVQAPAIAQTPAPAQAPASVQGSATTSAPATGPVQPPAPAPVSTPMAPPPIPPPPPDTRTGNSGVLVAPVLAPPPGIPPSMGGQMPMLGLPPGVKPFLAAPNTTPSPSPLSMPPPAPAAAPAPQPTDPPAASTPKPRVSVPPPPVPPTPAPTTPSQTPQTQRNSPSSKPPDTPQEPPAAASDPPREGKVTRSCIILQNFDEQAIKDKQVQTQILFGRKMNKLAKPAHPPLCVITNQPAKYRDPKTGLPYYNSYAYREIQRVYRGDYKWSRLLGAWVGRGDYAARGVPEWFLDPSKAKPAEPTEPSEQAKPAAGPTAEPVLAPVDGAGELKTEEKEGRPQDNPQNEARLEPVDGVKEPGVGVKGTETAAPSVPQPAGA
ncbi:YL1 nuclear protein-domain-containing protein [Thermothelomyces heterothallicus CBS 202.75]|uniref:YL1 nuclear protein-domain-containing protein n=1 Tax=Thermothelomyces heterothallicus CBS 202.75 TaxID=1149848 RepID=UPI0037444845